MGLPANAVVAVTYKGTLCGQTTLNTVHYRVSNPSTIPVVADEMDELANRFTAVGALDILTAYRGCLPDNMTVNYVRLQPVYPVRYRAVQKNIGLPGLADSSFVSNLQASITWVTELAGRNQTGGIRIPQGPNNVDNGKWLGAWQNVLMLLGESLSSLVNAGQGGGSYLPVIYHRSVNAFPKYQDVTSFIVQDTVRVIRRRTVGLGI